MALRTCDNCHIKLPFGRRRNRVGEQMLCDGCTEGKPGSPGRPLGSTASIEEILMTCEACGGEMGEAGLVRTGGLLRHAEGCPTPKTAAAMLAETYKGVPIKVKTRPGRDRGVYLAEAFIGGEVLTWEEFYSREQTDEKQQKALTQAKWIVDDAIERPDAYPVVDVALGREIPAYRLGSQHVAHDLGDGETIAHCPFCGSGQVIGRSDGTAECEFCTKSFTVQVQPQFSAMPQTVNGQPVVDPSMPDHDGQTPGEADQQVDGEPFAPAGSAAPDPTKFAPAGTAPKDPTQFAPAGSAKAATKTSVGAAEVWVIDEDETEWSRLLSSPNLTAKSLERAVGQYKSVKQWEVRVGGQRYTVEDYLAYLNDGSSMTPKTAVGSPPGVPEFITVDCQAEGCDKRHVGSYSHQGQWGEGPIYEVVCDHEPQWYSDFYTSEADVSHGQTTDAWKPWMGGYAPRGVSGEDLGLDFGGRHALFITPDGVAIPETAYLAHLALRVADDREAVMTQVRAERGEGTVAVAAEKKTTRRIRISQLRPGMKINGVEIKATNWKWSEATWPSQPYCIGGTLVMADGTSSWLDGAETWITVDKDDA